MDDSAIPQDVRKFLAEQLRSLMALELMLLLRADSGRERTAADLARELRSTPEWTQQELVRLGERGLVVTIEAQPRRFCFNQAAAGADGPLAWLAASYPERRFSILQAIYPPSSEPIQSFADAFKLRKEPPDG